MNSIALEKIERFFEKESFSNYKDILIFQNQDGSYELFNKYRISQENNLYNVTFNTGFTNKSFSSLRNAVAWCIFDNRNKISQTKRIEHLDKIIAGIDVSIQVHKNLIDKTQELENKLIFVSKLSQEQAKKKQMIKEMDDFIEESKRWQTRKFLAK